MASGGGISRFASRKPPSSNGGKTTSVAHSVPTGNDQKVDSTTSKFSFGCSNGISDSNSTSGDDQFDFLVGDNSMSGDDFFMMNDDSFNRDVDCTVVDSNKSTEQKKFPFLEPTDGSNAGIALFRGRTTTTPNSHDSIVPKQGNEDEKKEPANTMPKFSMPTSRIATGSDVTFERNHHNQMVDDNRTNMAPQSTPDGRVLPMPVYPNVITPHASNTAFIERCDKNENGFAPMINDRSHVSPSQENSQQPMGPPPNRNATAVTPSEIVNITRFNGAQGNGTAVAKLFLIDEPSVSSEKDSDASSAAFLKVNGANAYDTTKSDDGNSTDFHQRHQQFTTMIRDLHDMDTKLQDKMFDGTLQVDVATALLLQMKCNLYQVTNQILDQLDYVNVALREFLPECVEEE